MKTLLFTIIFLFAAICQRCDNFRPTGIAEPIKKEVSYDVNKDEFINKLIITKPISKTIFINDLYHHVSYTFRWDECEIRIVHYLQVSYRQKEGWEYFAHYKDGSILIINSYADIVKHMLNSDTYIKLQNLCKCYEKL